MKFKITIEEAKEVLANTSGKFATIIQHGTKRGLIYSPKMIDYQTPHKQDEAYIVVEGSGNFLRGDETVKFSKGDFLFVPTGMVHKFKEFIYALLIWVIFYGVLNCESIN